MSLTISFNEPSNPGNCKILFWGHKKIIQDLYKLISKYDTVYVPYSEIGDTASLEFGLWNLKAIKDGKLLANELVDYINLQNLNIEHSIKFLFKYWAFEATMIAQKKSYRSTLSAYYLLSPVSLLKIVDFCQKYNFWPSEESVFNLFEKSDHMYQNNIPYCEPLMPYEYEIEQFTKEPRTSYGEIRKNARILAQGLRDSSSSLGKLPAEVLVHIATLTRTHEVHSYDGARKIGHDNLGRPAINSSESRIIIGNNRNRFHTVNDHGQQDEQQYNLFSKCTII